MITWIDVETTGLDPTEDILLEVAVVVTGDHLEAIDSFSTLINADANYIASRISTEVYTMHMASGLLHALVSSDNPPVHEAEQQLCDWYEATVGGAKLPMAGSTVQFDRSFLQLQMPKFEQMFHYRNIDISTLKELRALWRPDIREVPRPHKKKHRALSDIHDTLAEAQHYYQEWLVPS